MTCDPSLTRAFPVPSTTEEETAQPGPADAGVPDGGTDAATPETTTATETTVQTVTVTATSTSTSTLETVTSFTSTSYVCDGSPCALP